MGRTLTLISNPGSASRKYGLYHRNECVAQLHFELSEAGDVVCELSQGEGASRRLPAGIPMVEQAAESVMQVLQAANILTEGEDTIARIAVRVVAPSSYFLFDRIVDDEFISTLENTELRAPLHIRATLDELRRLRLHFPQAKVIGVSDSAFHITKPDYAWNYGLPLDDADRFDIKRFGYHGLSVASAVDALRENEKLTPRVIVCHLGGGASVTAVYKGRSFDTTMGYSPLEGVVMATRSGAIDPTAVRELQRVLGLSTDQAEEYLNEHSGLLGLSGTSSDIRELLESEVAGDHRAALALQTYIYSIQKAIGQMIAAIGGADSLVFTGTVGERSAQIRSRIVERLDFADFILDKRSNEACNEPETPTVISRLARSKPVYVIHANEAAQMLKVAHKL
jgi:acetate kinase